VFAKLGIDYCCHGNVALKTACDRLGLDVENVKKKLMEESPRGKDDQSHLADLSPPQLAEHIVQTHHAFTREHVNMLSPIVDKVVRVHAGHNPKLPEIQAVFRRIGTEMLPHMDHEEAEFFPALAVYETLAKRDDLDADESQRLNRATHVIKENLKSLAEEHELVGNLLAKLRTAVDDYKMPHYACATYRHMLRELEALEQDIKLHVSKETGLLQVKVQHNLASGVERVQA